MPSLKPAPAKKQKKKQLPPVGAVVYRWVGRHTKEVVIGVVALILIVLFTNEVKALLIIGLLAAAGAFSQLYRRAIHMPPFIELVTFGTVMVGYVYGPWAGAVFGVVVTLAAEVMSSALDGFVIAYVPGRAIVGMLAGYMAGDIVGTGIVMSVLYNVIAQPLYLIQNDLGLRSKALFYIAGNIAVNILFFKTIAEPLLSVML